MLTLEKIAKDLQAIDDECYAKNRARKAITDLYSTRHLTLNPDDIPWDAIKENPTLPNANKSSAAFSLKEDLMCQTCLSSLWSCKHNPNRGKTAEEWQAHYNATKPDTTVLDENGVQKAVRRRGRRSKPVVITNDMKDDFISAYRAGETIQVIGIRFKVSSAEISAVLKDAGVEVRRGRGASKSATSKKELDATLSKKLAKEYSDGKNITQLATSHGLLPMIVSQALKSEGVVLRPRGRPSLGNIKLGKTRSTNLVSPEIIKSAKAMAKKGNGVVAIAKELNVNPNELSKALKAIGLTFQRGRKATK